MKIDVIDMDDRVLGTHRRGLAQSSGSTVIEMYGMCNGVSQMVTEIVRVAAPRSIDVLRIWGHGWSGGQLIAAGASAQVGVDHGSALWAHNMAQYGSDLSRLNRYFCAGGRVGEHQKVSGTVDWHWRVNFEPGYGVFRSPIDHFSSWIRSSATQWPGMFLIDLRSVASFRPVSG